MIKTNVPMPGIASKSNYDLDVNDDGRVDEHDFQHVSDRIMEEDHDDRLNIRRLKELKAEDALIERQRRKEEAENDRILAEEKKIQRLENRGPLRKKLEGGMDKVSQYIKEGRQQPAPARHPRRKGAVPARRVQQYDDPGRSHRQPIQAVSRSPTESRFAGMSMSLSNFTAGVLGSGGTGAAPAVQQNHLLNFNQSLLPRGKGVSNSGQMKGSDHLLKFSSGLLGGNRSVSKSNKGKKSKSKSFLRLI
jgi:hypothetical protein